jgi:hypothetical protein
MDKLNVDNNRTERIQTVLESLETLHPIDTTSPIAVIAPSNTHLRWKHGLRTVRDWRKKQGQPLVRHFEFLTLKQFAANLDNSSYTLYDDSRWIFIVDDVDPDNRNALRLQLQKLDTEAGHRLFMTRTDNKVLPNDYSVN